MLDTLEIERPKEAINIYRERERPPYGTVPMPVRTEASGR
jgi:hypothetical protein